LRLRRRGCPRACQLVYSLQLLWLLQAANLDFVGLVRYGDSPCAREIGGLCCRRLWRLNGVLEAEFCVVTGLQNWERAAVVDGGDLLTAGSHVQFVSLSGSDGPAARKELAGGKEIADGSVLNRAFHRFTQPAASRADVIVPGSGRGVCGRLRRGGVGNSSIPGSAIRRDCLKPVGRKVARFASFANSSSSRLCPLGTPSGGASIPWDRLLASEVRQWAFDWGMILSKHPAHR
jgi:hypothetical protein